MVDSLGRLGALESLHISANLELREGEREGEGEGDAFLTSQVASFWIRCRRG